MIVEAASGLNVNLPNVQTKPFRFRYGRGFEKKVQGGTCEGVRGPHHLSLVCEAGEIRTEQETETGRGELH